MSTAWTDERARTVLRQIFDAAVASADPGRAVLRHLPEKPRGRCVVVGAGKASAAMAAALDAAWPDVDLTGVAAATRPARLVSLVISDAPGDDPAWNRLPGFLFLSACARVGWVL